MAGSLDRWMVSVLMLVLDDETMLVHASVLETLMIMMIMTIAGGTTGDDRAALLLLLLMMMQWRPA
ncbi:GL18693 [Drosophila persimilis]|uniref:GL18693 n=1 Tax=Drosophila persimilis TaxID=7234 RepID=B4G996_DROPE|nr:GL18693 [Drosophila persimilis]